MKKEIHFTILSKISSYVLFKVLAQDCLKQAILEYDTIGTSGPDQASLSFFFQITLQAKNGFTFKCSWKSFTLLISSLENFQVGEYYRR